MQTVTLLSTESEDSNFSDNDDKVIEINDNTFLATSVANYRRREMQEFKRKNSNRKDTSYASLKDMQKIISKSLEIDERKVKETNAQKLVLSEQKWNNKMWNSILEEGEIDKSDHVHLIHIPSKSTINLEPKAPPG